MTSYSKDDLIFIECSSELGAGTRGSSLGIGALKTAARKNSMDLFSQYEVIVLKDENCRLDKQPGVVSKAKHIESISRMLKQNSLAISDSYSKKKFPIILSADHSNAAGFVQGTLNSFSDETIGVIWIDAHADLHSPYTSPSGNMHGMSLSIASGTNNLDCKRNELSESVRADWDKLIQNEKHLSLSNVAFVGLRSVEPEEQYLIDNFVRHTIKVDEYRNFSDKEFVENLKSQLSNCHKIYLSLDVDSMDPELVSDGTGTPVPGGFSSSEIISMIVALFDSMEICCFEITEINPTLDSRKNGMAEAALEILETVLNSCFEA